MGRRQQAEPQEADKNILVPGKGLRASALNLEPETPQLRWWTPSKISLRQGMMAYAYGPSSGEPGQHRENLSQKWGEGRWW